MSQTPRKVAKQYDIVAKVYAESFTGEHEKKPMDQEILHRFSKEIENRRPVWDLGSRRAYVFARKPNFLYRS